MKIHTHLFLIILLWIGLPALLFGYFQFTGSGPIDIQAVLFIFYTGFSWSIAILTFVMEFARRQVLQSDSSLPAGLRLSAYGSIALALAMVTSPWIQTSTMLTIAKIFCLGACYCGLAGLLYRFVRRKYS